MGTLLPSLLLYFSRKNFPTPFHDRYVYAQAFRYVHFIYIVGLIITHELTGTKPIRTVIARNTRQSCAHIGDKFPAYTHKL